MMLMGYYLYGVGARLELEGRAENRRTSAVRYLSGVAGVGCESELGVTRLCVRDPPQANSPNTTLPNRNLEAALAFITRVDAGPEYTVPVPVSESESVSVSH